MSINCLLKALSLAMLTLLSLKSNSQRKYIRTADSLANAIMKQLSNNEREKAYLVTNKAIFTPGETVWFRAFLLHSLSNKISTISKTLFVDVVDAREKRISTTLLNSRDQQTSGRLVLPDSLPSGPYWVRAYTQTMATLDTFRAAIVPIYYYNPAREDSSLAADKKRLDYDSLPSVHFYAEGGTLVTGATSGIVIHIADQSGRPIKMNGLLKDSHDSVITEFFTDTYGLCKVDLYPSRYRKYRAEITWKGKVHSFELPPFNFYAGQLSIHRSENGSFLVRTMLEDSIYSRRAITYLIAVARGTVYYAGVGHGRYEGEIPEKRFPKGIVTFLLFDASGRLLSERSVYVGNGNIDFRSALDKEVYRHREKAVLHTTSWNDLTQALPSSLTIAVADSNTLALQGGDNYETVNKVINGKEDDWTMAHLKDLPENEIDLLMLCVTDRFKRLFADSAVSLNRESDSLLYIKGSIKPVNKRSAGHKLITLLSTAPLTYFMTDTTDASGRFCFPTSAYPDSTQFALQAGRNSTIDQTFTLQVDSLRLPVFHTPASLRRPLDLYGPELRSFLFHYGDTMSPGSKRGMLREVVVKAAKPQYLKQRASFTSTLITSDNLIERGRVTLGDALLGRTDIDLLSTSRYPLLIIDGNVFPMGANDLVSSFKPVGGTVGASPTLAGSHAPSSMGNPGANNQSGGGGGEMDLKEFSDTYHFLNTLVIKDIDFIEILSPFVAIDYGAQGRYGAIFIHTKRADGIFDSPGLHIYYARGYCKDVPFPAVTYATKEARNETTPDRRATLFWTGNVLPNTEGYYTAEFFTNDVSGTYKVNISGITVHGDIIYDTLGFRIR